MTPAPVPDECAADALAALPDFQDALQSHIALWSPQRDHDLVAWLSLLADDGLVASPLSSVSVWALPFHSGGVWRCEPAVVDKAAASRQMFRSLADVPAAELAKRVLVLQVGGCLPLSGSLLLITR